MIKAFAAVGPGEDLKLINFKFEDISDDQVDIEVKYCGICHSDLSMIDNALGMTTYPLVPGHEIAGVISKTGKNVTGLKVGDKVGLGWHSSFCNECNDCHSSDHNFCVEAEGTILGRHGGFATKVRAQQNSVIKIPENLDLAFVGPLMCGGITVFNPLIQYSIGPTSHVAVIGIGGLGHMAIKFLKSWGCHVTAFTSSESKKEEAIQLGADQVLNSRNIDEIANAARSFDLLISTVNVKLDWNLYLETLKPKGRLHFVGLTLEPLDIQLFPLLTAQRSISSSPVGSPESIKKMLDFSNRHQILPQIELFKMSQINEAIKKLREGRARYRIVLENDIGGIQ